MRALCLVALVGLAAGGLFGLTMWLFNKPGTAPVHAELPLQPDFSPPKR